MKQCFALLSGNPAVMKIDFLLYKVSGRFPFRTSHLLLKTTSADSEHLSPIE